MKKIYSILAAAAVCAAANAQTTTRTQFSNVKKAPATAFSLTGVQKLSSMKLQDNGKQHQASARRKFPTPTVETPIVEQPAGKLHSETYRLSYGFYSDDFGRWFTDVDGQKGVYVEGDDGKVYLKNPLSTYPTNTWLTATRGEGDTLNVDLPQAIYHEEYTDFFGNPAELIAYATRMSYADNACKVDDTSQRIQFVMRNDSLIKVDDNSLLGLCDEYGDWYGYGDWNIAIGPMTEKTIAPDAPETAQPYTVEYSYHDSYTDSDERLRYPCKVVFDGDNVYINGLTTNDVDGWVKGTLKDDKFVFDNQQFIGYDKKYGRYCYFSPIYYKSTVDAEGSAVDSIFIADPIALNFNADEQTLDGEGIIATNFGRNTIYIDKEFKDPKLAYWDQKPGAPKDPVFTALYDYNPDDYGTGNFTFRLSNFTNDGTYLDQSKCYYNVFLDGEKYTYSTDEYDKLTQTLTDIPYDYTDKWNIFIFGTLRNLYFNGADWKTVGVQCFYRDDDGTEYRSHRVTAKLKKDETGINTVNTSEEGTATYSDLSGRRVSNPSHGVYLKTVTAKDGSRHTTKLVVK